MTRPDIQRRVQPPPHGQVGYLQLPALEVARSAAFYQAVFGWTVDLQHGSFEAPGMIGQWTTDLKPAGSAGPVLWICADDLWPTLQKVVDNGGIVGSSRSTTQQGTGSASSCWPVPPGRKR